MEEGEVKFLDDHNPYVADSNFHFKWDPMHRINWKNISKVNFATLKLGIDVEKVFSLETVEDLAYTNLKHEEDYVFFTHEGRAALQVMQLGL